MNEFNWTNEEPIAKRDSGTHNGHWYPAIEVYTEVQGVDGTWLQRFILHDSSASNRFPVSRTGENKLELGDPQTLIDQWKTLNTKDDKDGD